MALALSGPFACSAGLPPAAAAAPEENTRDDEADQALPLAAQTPTLDPTRVEAVRTVCPEIVPDAASLRFGGDARPLECSRPGACRPHRQLIGASVAELHAFAGAPSTCRDEEWTYTFGRSCKDERDLLVVTVEGERVVAARHEHQFGDEACTITRP